MATKELKVCDVYGTTKDVCTFTVSVDGPNGAATSPWTVDLSPRALARLVGWIERGVTPPKAGKTGATDDA